jgi:uncharacterized protein
MVTGATGFVGKELINRLNEKGYKIKILTRNAESAKFHLFVHCEIFTWSPERTALFPSALKEVDVVINLAGEGIADARWSSARKRQIIKS